MADSTPICARLDAELVQLIDQAAANEGIGRSEIVRNVLMQWAFGNTPSADEGYRQALRIAPMLAIALIRRAEHTLPATLEEAQVILAESRVNAPHD